MHMRVHTGEKPMSVQLLINHFCNQANQNVTCRLFSLW